MTARAAGRLAWTLCAVALLAALLQVALRTPRLAELAELSDPFPVFPIITVATLAAAVVGALIVSRHPAHPVGWLFCVGNAVAELGLAAAAYYDHSRLSASPLPGASWAAWFQGMTGSGFTLGLLVLFLLLFPTGRLPSPRWRVVAVAAVVNLVVLEVGIAAILGSPADAVPLSVLQPLEGPERLVFEGTQWVLLVCLLCGVASIVVRRRRATGVLRQQLRVFTVAGFCLAGSIALLVLAGPLEDLGVPRSVVQGVFFLSYGGLPVAAGLAMLRYRLYDIDLLLNRAAVLTSLAAVTTAAYVAVVVATGAVLGDRIGSGKTVSLAATALVALAVQPVRRRLRRLADTLVYGRRATPYEVLATFADRLGGALSVDETLPRMAEAAARGLGARSASVRVLLPDGSERTTRWPAGTAPGRADLVVPVAHAGEDIGDVSLDLPAGAVPSERGVDLVSGLAAQAGLALRNVQLTAELRTHLEELTAQSEAVAASRQRLLSAQTVERQRLERRISASVHPHLAAVAEGLHEVGATLHDHRRAAAVLDALAARATAALEALRDIARGVFPPVLADKGLLPALAAAARTSAGAAEVTAPGAVPRLPAATESAAYFCCTDVFAAAGDAGVPVTCEVALDATELRIVLSAQALPPSVLASVEDRATAFGGAVTVRATAPVQLEVLLPLARPEAGEPAAPRELASR